MGVKLENVEFLLMSFRLLARLPPPKHHRKNIYCAELKFVQNSTKFTSWNLSTSGWKLQLLVIMFFLAMVYHAKHSILVPKQKMF